MMRSANKQVLFYVIRMLTFLPSLILSLLKLNNNINVTVVKYSNESTTPCKLLFLTHGTCMGQREGGKRDKS